ncbi:hypothetical protein DFH07DRAFT_778934 [Mycena maculata]|uniref:Uncharacterized protein n=1 Tax=Mycena maculata TaxID=230809 RepID=A0AAD7N0I9_9AGAR|nr:hypothetical protein DFH07DRAFT_778934 [Mycena maculata]
MGLFGPVDLGKTVTKHESNEKQRKDLLLIQKWCQDIPISLLADQREFFFTPGLRNLLYKLQEFKSIPSGRKTEDMKERQRRVQRKKLYGFVYMWLGLGEEWLCCAETVQNGDMLNDILDCKVTRHRNDGKDTMAAMFAAIPQCSRRSNQQVKQLLKFTGQHTFYNLKYHPQTFGHDKPLKQVADIIPIPRTRRKAEEDVEEKKSVKWGKCAPQKRPQNNKNSKIHSVFILRSGTTAAKGADTANLNLKYYYSVFTLQRVTEG